MSFVLDIKYIIQMAFTNEIITQVRFNTTTPQWENNEKNWFRQDQCSAWIRLNDYWNRDSIYWWEIDHIKSVANWWTDILSNLRALHWKNNVVTSDWRLACPVKSNWTQNIGV